MKADALRIHNGRTRRGCSGLASTATRWLAAVALVGAAAGAQAQVCSLYDDFSATTIDPTRWSGASRGRSLESFKLVSGGALLLGNITYGDTGTDVGRRTGRTGVQLNNTGGPGNLLGLGASVTMLTADSQDCPTNPDTGRARAQVRGHFFNNGASTGPGDATGDVAALIQLARSSDGSDAIEWYVWRCDDAPCDAFTYLDTGTFTTSWSLGLPNVVFVFWDSANDQFLFSVDAELVISPYTEADAGVPNADFPINVLRVRHLSENCAAGPPRASSGFVAFDNVFVCLPGP